MSKTSTERTREMREKRKADGIEQLNIYAHRLDFPAIKIFVAELLKKRILKKTENNS